MVSPNSGIRLFAFTDYAAVSRNGFISYFSCIILVLIFFFFNPEYQSIYDFGKYILLNTLKFLKFKILKSSQVSS